MQTMDEKAQHSYPAGLLAHVFTFQFPAFHTIFILKYFRGLLFPLYFSFTEVCTVNIITAYIWLPGFYHNWGEIQTVNT